MASAVTPLTIDEEFTRRYPRSSELFERQRELTPGGFTHAARVLEPFPLFIAANRGSRKWDVDGFEHVDYWQGHGAMLLGHAHPAVVEAIARQAADGLHAGGESPLAVEWEALVQSMVPSAERVRFVASGGEATQLALRVARAWAGRDRIVKFQGAFHGWHDAVQVGWLPPYEIPSSIGIPKAVERTVSALPFNDLDAVARELERSDDVAGVLIEPGGAYDDRIPTDPSFLARLRELTSAHGVALIFDEVVTGFRYARGGAQEHFGVTPDITALGKIVGGGVPVGAVVGREEVMDVLAWRPDRERARFGMIPHPGTWNANPLAAAAGIATLELVRDTDAVERAIEQARRIAAGFDAVFERRSIAGFAYARASMFKLGRGERPGMVDGDFSERVAETEQLLAGWGDLEPLIRRAMLLEGVDLMRIDGMVSAAHSDADVEQTIDAFDRAWARIEREVDLSQA